MANRTKITADGSRFCTIKFECAHTGEMRTIVASAPHDGGYVRDQSGNQLCEHLCSMGSTLTWNGRGTVADLIRREYRRMRAAEAREYRREMGL